MQSPSMPCYILSVRVPLRKCVRQWGGHIRQYLLRVPVSDVFRIGVEIFGLQCIIMAEFVRVDQCRDVFHILPHTIRLLLYVR